MRRHLVEAELLVIIGTDPFRAVDGALLERGIDVATANLLRHRAKLLQYAPGKAADTEFKTLQIIEGVDFLAEPAAHLTARIASEKCVTIVTFVELVQKLFAAPQDIPSLVEALVGSKWHRSAKGEGRILAKIIIRRRVTHLDRSVLHGIEDLQRGHYFTGGEELYLKLVVGGFGNRLGQHVGSAVQRIKRFRPARRHAPFQFRH